MLALPEPVRVSEEAVHACPPTAEPQGARAWHGQCCVPHCGPWTPASHVRAPAPLWTHAHTAPLASGARRNQEGSQWWFEIPRTWHCEMFVLMSQRSWSTNEVYVLSHGATERHVFE